MSDDDEQTQQHCERTIQYIFQLYKLNSNVDVKTIVTTLKWNNMSLIFQNVRTTEIMHVKDDGF